MHAEALRLGKAFISGFWASNHEMRWLALEQEHELWLTPDTVLVGKVDAQGLTGDGEPFFGDWKTASVNKKRYIDREKAKWRMEPQALTYGVLMGTRPNPVHTFTVRWVFKTDPATVDFEWYTYTKAEVGWWKDELVDIANTIRQHRINRLLDPPNWPTRLTNCTPYGENYACPFRNEGCWQHNFVHIPDNMRPRTESHLAIENALLREHNENEKLVVLDASRVKDFLQCDERYRKLWESGGLHEDNENLEIGGDFHSIIHQHLEQIKEKQQ